MILTFAWLFQTVNVRDFFNIRARKFYFLKHKKSFLLRKHKNFFNLGARKFRFLKYKKLFRVGFFNCFELGLKSALGNSIVYYYHNAVPNSSSLLSGSSFLIKTIFSPFFYLFLFKKGESSNFLS